MRSFIIGILHGVLFVAVPFGLVSYIAGQGTVLGCDQENNELLG
jgi:hypothetical protein